MSSSTRARTRRASSLVAALGVLIGTFLVASPAQAAVGVELTVTDTTITAGESVTLAWTSAEAIDLVASGSWSGNKTNPAGDELVTPAATGDLTYTLTATDQNGREATDSVTVTVAPAAPADITPAPVTFPDPCTVVVPTTANVTYFVNYGGNDVEEVDADTYDGTDFSDGELVTFYAEANQGFTLADDAVTEWEYTAPDECFGTEATLVKVNNDTCGALTFSNVAGAALTVLYGNEGSPGPDGVFDLAAGASHTVKTKRDEIFFIAFPTGEEDNRVHFGSTDVLQDCDNGSGGGHPTVAPAAGVAAR